MPVAVKHHRMMHHRGGGGANEEQARHGMHPQDKQQVVDQMRQKLPFLYGVQEQWAPIAVLTPAFGLQIPATKVTKNGFLAFYYLYLVATVTVTAAGSAGTPSPLNLVQYLYLTYNGGYQYRNLGGEDLYVMQLVRTMGTDPVQGTSTWQNYNPASATAQAVSWMLGDYVAENLGPNADRYLLAAQARNADLYYNIQFANASAIVANTETITLTAATLYIEGLFFLDPPSYDIFDEPDLDTVQQIAVDQSYTSVIIGDNTVTVLPLNGPKYLGLAFKVVTNGTPDTQGAASITGRVQIKFNNGFVRYDMNPAHLNNFLQIATQRNQVGPTATPYFAPLPKGWYYFDFLSDLSILNVSSVAGRNVIDTERLASFWLIVTINSGTNITANNLIKVVSRVENPAVFGTNKLESPKLAARHGRAQ